MTQRAHLSALPLGCAGFVTSFVHGFNTTAMAVVVAALMFFYPSVQVQAQFKEIKRLGTNEALCKGGVSGDAGLKAWSQANQGEIRKILGDAGVPEVGDKLLAKIAAGDFSQTSVKTGSEFLWMGRRKKGVPVAQPNVRYVGKKEHPAYQISVTENCKTHTVVIPEICCNVSLLATAPVPPPGPPTLDVTPPDSCDGGVVDIRALSDEGSNLDIVLVGPDGQERKVTANELNGNLNVQGAGAYSVKAGASGACGASKDMTVASFDIAACPVKEMTKKPEMKPERAIIPFLAGFVGMQHRSRDLCNCYDDLDEGLLGGRGGIMYPVTDRVSLFGQLGAAFNAEDSGWSTLHADVGVESRVGERGFIGGGVGIWDINNSVYRDPTLFIHGGVDTPWSVGGKTIQWFIEGRKWLDEPFEDQDLDDDYSALTGLRLMYK